jgi:hypothetical protein
MQFLTVLLVSLVSLLVGAIPVPSTVTAISTKGIPIAISNGLLLRPSENDTDLASKTLRFTNNKFNDSHRPKKLFSDSQIIQTEPGKHCITSRLEILMLTDEVQSKAGHPILVDPQALEGRSIEVSTGDKAVNSNIYRRGRSDASFCSIIRLRYPKWLKFCPLGSLPGPDGPSDIPPLPNPYPARPGEETGNE